MRIKTRTHTAHSVEIDGVEVELEFEPCNEHDVLAERVGDTLVVAYLVNDSDFGDIDELLGDGMGTLYSFHRHAGRDQHQAGLAALGRDIYGEVDEDIEPDVDAVLLDCYEHGGQIWSVSGDGMQCQFDTAHGAGVWVPDGYIVQELEKLGKTSRSQKRRAQALKYCEQFLDQYNAIINGDVYGCVTQVFDLSEVDGEPAGLPRDDHDSCWGYVGHKHASECLKSDHFDHVVESLKKELETA